MTSISPRILIVDDDRVLRELLVRYLSENGFTAGGVVDGVAMRDHLARHPVDLILLDLMLPGEDGLSLARSLRANAGPPVIMLSARGSAVDRIVGLEVGADDYLAKPFDHRELLARIRAVLRRRPERDETDSRPVRFGACVLDAKGRQLTRNGEPVKLSGSEFSLLKVFVTHPNQVLTRDRLVELLRGYERAPFDRMVDVRVTRLRRKVEADPANPIFIRTIRGEGYQFTPSGNTGLHT